jgi:hypothetical protein
MKSQLSLKFQASVERTLDLAPGSMDIEERSIALVPAVALWLAGLGRYIGALRVRLGTLSRVAELSQHQADGRKFQKCEGVAVEIFPILRETTAAAEPSNRAFDDPTPG